MSLGNLLFFYARKKKRYQKHGDSIFRFRDIRCDGNARKCAYAICSRRLMSLLSILHHPSFSAIVQPYLGFVVCNWHKDTFLAFSINSHLEFGRLQSLSYPKILTQNISEATKEIQTTFFIPTLDTTTNFVIMII